MPAQENFTTKPPWGFGWLVSLVELSVEQARKVRRPLTFFAAMGFALLPAIPLVLWLAPGEPPIVRTALAIGLGASIPVDIICVLIWSIIRINKNPHAFDDE